jgi:hypothetical protein
MALQTPAGSRIDELEGAECDSSVLLNQLRAGAANRAQAAGNSR